MRTIPDWESDPISVICAPVSGALITRIPQWYALEVLDREPGREFKHSAEERRKVQERVRKCRARKRLA